MKNLKIQMCNQKIILLFFYSSRQKRNVDEAWLNSQCEFIANSTKQLNGEILGLEDPKAEAMSLEDLKATVEELKTAIQNLSSRQTRFERRRRKRAIFAAIPVGLVALGKLIASAIVGASSGAVVVAASAGLGSVITEAAL